MKATVGTFVSVVLVPTTKVVTASLLLAILSGSVTIIMQSEYVTAIKVINVMLFLPLAAEFNPDEHEPP